MAHFHGCQATPGNPRAPSGRKAEEESQQSPFPRGDMPPPPGSWPHPFTRRMEQLAFRPLGPVRVARGGSAPLESAALINSPVPFFPAPWADDFVRRAPNSVARPKGGESKDQMETMAHFPGVQSHPPGNWQHSYALRASGVAFWPLGPVSVARGSPAPLVRAPHQLPLSSGFLATWAGESLVCQITLVRPRGGKTKDKVWIGGPSSRGTKPPLATLVRPAGRRNCGDPQRRASERSAESHKDHFWSTKKSFCATKNDL